MSRRVRSTAVALLLAIPAAPAHAQRTGAWPEQSVRGLAAVGLSASVIRQGDYPSSWSGGISYAPFLSEHLQGGLAVGYFGGGDDYHAGQISAAVNYWIGGNHRSRPYVGAFAGLGAGTGGDASHAWGGDVGWAYFVTPFTALHATLAAQRYSSSTDTYSDLTLGVQPYAFGRARAPGGFRAGQPGAFDLSLGASAEFSPNRAYRLRAGVAPFLFRTLQMGGMLDAMYLPAAGPELDEALETRTFEGFVRAYYPTRGAIQPFAGGVVSTTHGTSDIQEGSRGGSVGVRAYPNPGVALDVLVELREFTHRGAAEEFPGLPNRTTLRAAVTTHVPRRVRR